MASRGRKRAGDSLLNIPVTKRRKLEQEHNLTALKNFATNIRIDSVESTHAANSGHPTTCSSIAEILSVLFFDKSGMRYFATDPRNYSNDKLVLSKGHAAPALYSAWSQAGLFPRQDLLNLRKLSSDLEGHPTPRLNFVDVATGSLGQGLSVACGLAYSMQLLEGGQQKVYVIMGDGEIAEGGVWEAVNFASFYKLSSIIAFVDANRLGQSRATMYEHDLSVYKQRFQSFGWQAYVIDGHDVQSIIHVLDEAKQATNPVVIICKTFKGKDYVEIENEMNWHGKPLGDKSQTVIDHLKTLLEETQEQSTSLEPENSMPVPEIVSISLPDPTFEQNSQIATRQAYGFGLKQLGYSSDRVVALDGDMKNSTFSINFETDHPDRFIECFIAEQNMIGTALGLSCRGKIPFASTFAAFLTRAYDHIRLIGLSFGNVKICGSHCGVSIGPDGGSQMGLEDIAMIRAIPDSVILYPSEAVGAFKAVELAANYKGLVYIRTSRPNAPMLYQNDQKFEIGKSLVLRQSEEDKLCVIGAGVTLHEALKAYETLSQEGIKIRVVDIYSVKPLDKDGLELNAKQAGGKVITVEDHYIQGGIFEAVNGQLASKGVSVYGLAVTEIPRSGLPEELLEVFGISANHIVRKVKELLA